MIRLQSIFFKPFFVNTPDTFFDGFKLFLAPFFFGGGGGKSANDLLNRKKTLLWKQFRPSQASFPIIEVVFQKALEVGLIEKAAEVSFYTYDEV
jgi:hypothetical protein